MFWSSPSLGVSKTGSADLFARQKVNLAITKARLEKKKLYESSECFGCVDEQTQRFASLTY